MAPFIASRTKINVFMTIEIVNVCISCDQIPIVNDGRGRLPILTPLSGYPNKTNSFTGKIISKLGLGVYCIRLQSCQTWPLYIIYLGEEM